MFVGDRCSRASGSPAGAPVRVAPASCRLWSTTVLVLDGLGFPFGVPRPSAFRTDPFGSILLPISVFLGIRTVVIVLPGTIPIPVVERTRNEQK